MSRPILLVVLMILSASTSYAIGDEVAVVVSAKSKVDKLTDEQIFDIFSSKTSTFPNGETSVPIDQQPGVNIRGTFYTKVCNKTSQQMQSYWAKMIFTGKGRPPKTASSSAEVKSILANNPDAIGYIEKSAVDSSVRVLLSATD